MLGKITSHIRQYTLSEIVLFLFLLIFPFEKHVAVYALYVFFASILFSGSWSTFKLRLQQNKTLLAMVGIYFLYLLGIVIDGEYNFAIEQKVSLLVFPFAFFYAKIDFRKVYTKALFVYLFAASSSILFCFVVAFYRYANTGDISYLFYDKLSFFIHAGYYAYYLCFAFAIAIEALLFHDFSTKKKILLFAAGMLLFMGILFLTTKASLLAVSALLLFFGIKYVVVTKRWGNALIALLFVLAVFSVAYFELPRLKERINTFFTSMQSNPKLADSTSSRKMIWNNALDLIAQKPFFGHGPHTNEVLFESYRKTGMMHEFSHRFNAHNEFLQILLVLGLAGFLLLILLLVIGFYSAWQSKDFLFFAFLLIVFFGFATESMLDTEAGILYFCFFYCFFTLSNTDVNA